MAVKKNTKEELNENGRKRNPYSIKKIVIDKLFGHYNYKLPNEDNHIDFSKMFILYGDNGSGKTTILKCLFYLLSTRDKVGHKSNLAKIKFENFRIIFENDLEIGAEREGSLIGGFKFYIKAKGTLLYDLKLITDDELSVNFKDGTEENSKLKKMYRYIADLNISIYYLEDDRELLSNHWTPKDQNDSFLFREGLVFDPINKKLSTSARVQDRFDLDKAMQKFINWIRDRVINSSNIGEMDALKIYTDLLKSIQKSESASKFEISKSELIQTIKDVSIRSVDFANFGLISKNEYSEIESILSRIRSADKIELTYRIIKPFFDSLEARLSALEWLKDLLYDFISNVNNYFSRKTISFNLNDGFQIQHEKGEILDFPSLSSGEKQLLLLFINTITASEEATIFIIDEPEISLNIKWQRNLLKTLLEFSKNENIQFVIATHSIELLASNLENVAKIGE